MLAANAPKGSGSIVSSQEWTVAEVVGIDMVDEAVLLWEVSKEPKWVLSLINDSEARWHSTYAILVCYYKMRASIQRYNEKAI